ncbi:MAG: hypothetical protein ACP5PA_06035 [Elusimicrobiales bacterium]
MLFILFIFFVYLPLESKDVYTGSFLNIPPAPYPTSLAESFAARVNADSVLYNPAGLGLLSYSSLSIAHNKYIEGLLQQYINAVIDTPYGNFSAFYSVMKSGDIISYDESENITGNTSISYSYYGFSYSKGFPYFDYARKKIDPMLITPSWSRIKPVGVYIPKVYRFSFGLTAKKLEERLDTEKRGINLFDGGVLLVLPGHFHIGASIQNVSSKSRFYQQYEKIPSTFRFGVAKDFSTIKQIINFIFTADYVGVEGNKNYLSMASEIDILKAFQMRFGYSTKDNPGFSRFVFGMGMTFDSFLTKESLVKGLRMDYAYLEHKYFGSTHRIGFQMIW